MRAGNEVLLTTDRYQEHVREFVKVWGRQRYRRPALLDSFLTYLPVQGAWILDVGCGVGQDARELNRIGQRVVGIDLVRPFLQYARRRGPLRVLQADMRALPFHARTFDGVWAAASVIHLRKQAARRLLVDLAGLVKPGGVLAATVAYGRRSGVSTNGWIPGRFFSRWTKASFRSALLSAGWQLLELKVVSNRERKGRWINAIAVLPD